MKRELAFANHISVEKNVTNVQKDMKNFPNVTAAKTHFLGTQIVQIVRALPKGVKVCLAIKILAFVIVLKIMQGRNVIPVQRLIGVFLPVNVILLGF